MVLRLIPEALATRQTSTSGRPKSPRVQVVLPEDLCERLNAAADSESRTVSNMAKVLIQQGLDRLDQARQTQAGVGALAKEKAVDSAMPAERFRTVLEQQELQTPRRLRGLPKRVRLYRPSR
ncbi:CopG antitoxin of type II toxin-antitoxin system [Synechococcus sp. Ace-Pa]|nr:CopG antitoxin of type II toxin-antitoxin system [Synechococcus sp. Ace-Pa]